MDNNQILKLIDSLSLSDKSNTHIWDKILDIDSDLKTSINGDNLLHIACVRRDVYAITKILDKHHNFFYLSDKNGNTCAHLLIMNNLFDLFKDMYIKYPDSITFTNNEGNNCAQLLLDISKKHDLKWLLNNTQEDMYGSLNNINYSGNTLLTGIINNTLDNDGNVELLEEIVKHKVIQLNIPVNNLPINCAIRKQNYIIVDYLLSYGADPNIRDVDNLVPLYHAISSYGGENDTNIYNIVKSLLDYGADVNYAGQEGDNLPINTMFLVINKKKIKNSDRVLNLLIDHKKANLNIKNRNLDIPVNIMLLNNVGKYLLPSTIFKILYKSNLNLQNLSGVTPLHLLAKTTMWKDYTELLRSKTLHIDSLVDDNNNTPLSYIKDSDLIEFVDIINSTPSIVKSKNNKRIKNYCTSDSENIDTQSCRTAVEAQLLNVERLSTTKQKEIKMPKHVKTNFGLFNADITHNCVYTLLLLKKYPNLLIPTQTYIADKVIHDITSLETLNAFRTPYGKLVSNVLSAYNEFFYELTPHLIIWRSKDIWYVDPNIDVYVHRLLKAPKIRFIMFKLTLVPHSTSTHANTLLYDKHINQVVRFEPYGPLDMLDNEYLDKMLYALFTRVISPKIVYIKPSDYLDQTHFQIVSSDTSEANKKLGDPMGFCLAWIYWFLELRLDNPDSNVNVLIKKAFTKIIRENIDTEDDTNKVLSYIRNYAHKLDIEKNTYLSSIGITKGNLYNILYNDKDMMLIIESLMRDVNKLVKDRT